MAAKLDMCRIIRSRVRHADGSTAILFRELDGIHVADYDTAVIYEVKFLSRSLIRELGPVGKRQLDRSANILRHSYRVVKTRLVYVGTEADASYLGLPYTAIDDLESDFGIVWISPAQIETACLSLGIQLPCGWSELDDKYGNVPAAA